MTVTLTTATRIGGAVVASGTTDTYDPAIEADLVSRGMATYVSRQGVMDTGVPVMVVSNPLTRGVELSVGLPVPSASYNGSAQYLKKWRAAVARMQSGGANARLAFLGDSTTMGLYSSGAHYAGGYQVSTPVLVAKLLTGRGIAANTASRFGDANVQRANLASYDSRMGVIPAAWGNGFITLAGANIQNNSTQDKLLFQPDGGYQFDRIDVWYLQNTGYDTFHVGVDGGASLLSTNGGAGALEIKKATATCALGNHVVNVWKGTANAANLSILGIACYSSTAPTIDVWNWGFNGARADTWASATSAVYSPLPAIAAYAPDLTVINLTINDALGSTAASAYKTYMQQIIDKCRLSGDVVLMTGTPIGTRTAEQQEVYVAACRDLATSNGLLLLDLYARDQSWANADSQGFAYSDGVHRTKIGNWDVANMLVGVIAP